MKTIKLFIYTIFLISCIQKKEKSTITFNVINNSKTIQKIKLSKFNFELDRMVEIDTLYEIAPNNSKVFTSQFLEPSIFSFRTNSIKEVKIAIEKSGFVNIELDETIKLESDVANISNFEVKIQELNRKHFQKMIQKFDKALKEDDKKTLIELEKKKDSVLKEFTKDMENAVRDMGVTALAFDALQYFDMNKNYAFIDETARKFKEEYPDGEMSKSLQRRIDVANRVSVGKKALEFNAKNLEGSEVKLTDFTGKYVLIDFWATWCRPCRVENPKLMLVYEEFKDLGFEIISISIDKDFGQWKEAIKADGLLSHQQILDSNLSIYKLYSLSTLPSNFLLDKKGLIIEKNIDAKQLSSQLNLLLKQQ